MSGYLYFFICLAFLIAGYAVYGVIAEKVFGVDRSRPTPVMTREDGVDYVKMPLWKMIVIQLLNIAGLGPVFGPIIGALYGPSALLWVVFGCVLGGAVHDYMSGMISLRYGGAGYRVLHRNIPDPRRRSLCRRTGEPPPQHFPGCSLLGLGCNYFRLLYLRNSLPH